MGAHSNHDRSFGSFSVVIHTPSYAPNEKKKTGEVHEHMTMISCDKQRKTLALRQFHPESFVSVYAVNTGAQADSEQLVAGGEE
ncbi:MAG TPA: hypothetical protein VK629_08325 [Steroidobacteraceae bacterium]|nr:hypothetical protein [Steroidobacteraceae bacterium]